MDAYGLTSVLTGQFEHLDSGCRSVRKSPKKLLQSVWDEITPELSRLVCAMGIAPDRVEDVLQDVYLTAWRKQPSGIGQGDLRRWLFRVTTNRCNLEHRRRSRWRKVSRGLTRVWGGSNCQPDATDAACRTEEQELVRRALERLEPQLRSILVLRYFAEFNSKEIGDILGLPDSTVRSQLRTARQHLAWELKRTGYTDD